MSKTTLIGAAWCSTMALALAAGSAAAAGNGNNGPDIVVGDVADTSSYGSGGAAGTPTRYAYDLGTVSCNLGSVNVDWVSSTNRHPVISQNVYRLKNNRFEQVGMSWLKHGFTALTQNLCSSCNGVGGSRLGVGCSDPYTGGLNGGQTRLGPRFEINAATGVYALPHAVPVGGANENGIRGRLQILADDVNPSLNAGAQYFGETQYVSFDDAGSLNGWNNVSYRTMNFGSGANFPSSMTGATQRMKAAIEAWKAADPTVRLVLLDIPGDGRMFVACRVSDNGNGTWHYEYAIENLTSNRSGGMFKVPLPAGAVVTNAESVNPFYHSGEPYDNRPFLPAISADAVTFLPQALSATPPGATEKPWATPGVAPTIQNAIRWGTMYNFRFDCNIAPSAALGTAKVGFANAGTGQFATFNDMTFAIQAPGAASEIAAPINDSCANAAQLHAGPNGWSTVGATSDGPAECNGGGSSAIDGDVWFYYTYAPPVGSTCTGASVTFTTLGSDFPAKVAVYSTCPTGPSTALACGADNLVSGGACGTVSTGQGTASVAAVANATYVVRVGSATGVTGNIVVNVTTPDCGQATYGAAGTVIPPANDACNAPFFIGDSTVGGQTGKAGTSVGGSPDGVSSCVSNNSSPDVWYSYTPTSSASVTIGTCNATAYDSVISAYTGACGALTEVPNGCDDDTTGCSGNSSIMTISATANIRYLIRVGGWNGGSGTFTLTVTGGGGIAPAAPANNNCASATAASAGVTPFNTAAATTDGIAHPGCALNGTGQIDRDVWFTYAAPAAGTLTASVCGSPFDTRMAIYSGTSCAGLETRLVVANDDFCGMSSQAVVNVAAPASHLIRIGGAGGASGAGSLSLTFTPAAPPSVFCCRGTTCVSVPSGSCTSPVAGLQAIERSSCGSPATSVATCCYADFTHDGSSTIDDLFIYINLWLGASPLAKIDGNMTAAPSIDDLFVFINYWLGGCQP